MSDRNPPAKLSYLRPIYIAYLIDVRGVDSQSGIIRLTGIGRRTIQATFNRLTDLGINIEKHGPIQSRTFSIESWGLIDRAKVIENIDSIEEALGVPKECRANYTKN